MRSLYLRMGLGKLWADFLSTEGDRKDGKKVQEVHE